MNLALKLSGYFYEFEKVYFDEIVENKIDDKIAWYIVKTPLFYHIYHQTVNSAALNLSKPLLSEQRRISRIIKFFFSFWKNWLHVIKKSRQSTTVVIRLTVDKRLKDGKFKNVLFDELILEDIIEDPLVLEISNQGVLLEPSYVKADSYLDHLSHVVTILSKKIKKQYLKHNEVEKLFQLVLRFLNEYDIKIRIEKDFIITKLSYYRAEYAVYIRFFRKLKVKVLVVTDQSFSGKMQAANELGIKVIEFQHGLMDEFYPHYTLPKKYRAYRKNLALHDKVVVFGEFHRQQILKHGFWDENDIVVTGNTQINEVRNYLESTEQSHLKLRVLFPTQGLYSFPNTKKVLHQLGNVNSDKVEVLIRPHPLEPENCLKYYRDVTRFSSVLKLIEDKVSIFNLIFESDVVLGFDSTTLLEAIAVGKPAVTIASYESPKGIHSMLNSNVLEEVIKIVVLEEDKLVSFLEELSSNNQLISNWKNECLRWGNFLYDENYLTNSRELFKTV
jgi:hypothetical protein